ncbi:hypothetical protein A2U01_0020909, partial [Trifolium medium]|nr:hypothetical protein [Trifolium medium]
MQILSLLFVLGFGVKPPCVGGLHCHAVDLTCAGEVDEEFSGNSESGRTGGGPAENHRLVDTITDPELDWVGPGPRGIASVFTPTTLGVFIIVEEDCE